MKRVAMVTSVLALMGGAWASGADPWRIEVLEGPVMDCSIDVGDVPQVAFATQFSGALGYGRRDGGVWSRGTLDIRVGPNVDMRVGADGAPRIVFAHRDDQEEWHLAFADRSSGDWTIENVVPWINGSPSLAVDAAPVAAPSARQP